MSHHAVWLAEVKASVWLGQSTGSRMLDCHLILALESCRPALCACSIDFRERMRTSKSRFQGKPRIKLCGPTRRNDQMPRLLRMVMLLGEFHRCLRSLRVDICGKRDR